jgi:hypothetical protein
MALAFYPRVAWRAWLMPPAAEGAARGAAIPPGDRQRCRFGAAWSKSERAVIVVHVRTRGLFREGCARLGCIPAP